MTNEKTLPTGFKAFGIVRRSDNFTLPPINWAHWGNMYDVELWQAAALSLNINPDTIKDPDRFNFDEYKDRLRLLVNWLAPSNKHPYQVRVMLCELAGKWCKVLKWQIPPELAAKAAIYNAYRDTAAPTEPNAPAAKVVAVPVAPVAKVGTNKKKWDDASLRALWEESILPGVTPTSLAKKYGVSRQRITKLINDAREKFSSRASLKKKNSWGHTIK